MGHTVSLRDIPRKIVSLVPSQTELLFDLGLETEVVGLTKFCIRPAHALKSKTQIGGTKNLNLEKIAALNPDLIIGNKEENERSQIEWLKERFPVWMSDIENLPQALDMMILIGSLTGKQPEAQLLCHRIKQGFDQIREEKKSLPARVLYLIWDKPMMAAGQKTFIHEMIELAGFHNIAPLLKKKSRYPEITPEEINTLSPDYLFLSTEPYPFQEKQIMDFQARFPQSRVVLVDGEMFSWYGSRLLHAPTYITQLKKSLEKESA